MPLESVSVRPGDIVLVVPNHIVSVEEHTWYKKESERLGFDLVFLPPGTQVVKATATLGFGKWFHNLTGNIFRIVP